MNTTKYIPLRKGDVIKRNDIYRTPEGKTWTVDSRGIILGVHVFGKEIAKDDSGWYRPIKN